MVVDHEKAWLALKAHISSKRSHGQDELFREMALIEVQSRIPEGEEAFDDRPVHSHEHTSSGHASHGEPVAMSASGAT
jgi:hypothetical protein